MATNAKTSNDFYSSDSGDADGVAGDSPPTTEESELVQFAKDDLKRRPITTIEELKIRTRLYENIGINFNKKSTLPRAQVDRRLRRLKRRYLKYESRATAGKELDRTKAIIHEVNAIQNQFKQADEQEAMRNREQIAAQQRNLTRQLVNHTSHVHVERRKVTNAYRNVFPIPFWVLPTMQRSTFGLHNHLNTCYRNSMIQALAHCPIFVQFILSDRYKAGVPGHSAHTHDDLALLYHFKELVKFLWEGSKTDNLEDKRKVKFLLEVFYKILQKYTNEQQHYWLFHVEEEADPMQLLEFLLLNLTQSLPQGSIRGSLEGIFGIQLRKERTCNRCGTPATSPADDLWAIPVILNNRPNKSTLSLLKEYFEPEVMETKCVSKECVERPLEPREVRTYLKAAPEILIIHINRMYLPVYGEKELKSDFQVIADKELDMSQFAGTLWKTSVEGLHYELIANVAHSGKEKNGHYITWARGPWGRVDRMSDTSVTPVQESELMNPPNGFKSCVLFYRCTRPTPDKLSLIGDEVRYKEPPRRWASA